MGKAIWRFLCLPAGLPRLRKAHLLISVHVPRDVAGAASPVCRRARVFSAAVGSPDSASEMTVAPGMAF